MQISAMVNTMTIQISFSTITGTSYPAEIMLWDFQRVMSLDGRLRTPSESSIRTGELQQHLSKGPILMNLDY